MRKYMILCAAFLFAACAVSAGENARKAAALKLAICPDEAVEVEETPAAAPVQVAPVQAAVVSEVVGVCAAPVVTCPLPAQTCAPAQPKAKKQLVYVEEEYVRDEVHTEIVEEPRVRKVRNTYDVVHEKTVRDSLIAKVPSPTGNAPRLARGNNQRIKQYTKKETFVEEENYIAKVKYRKVYPTVRTRKVPMLVDVEEPTN